MNQFSYILILLKIGKRLLLIIYKWLAIGYKIL